MTKQAVSYRPAQIALHWLVMFGVIVQVAIHEPIVRETMAYYTGTAPNPSDATLAMTHGLLGTLVFLAVMARLWLRFRSGVPGHAPGISYTQAFIATFVHNVLYALLVLVSITGMITRSGAANLGNLHFYFNAAMVLLVVLHAGAAIYNQYVRNDGTLARMLPVLRR
jgi:superoxide oxidase